jgi:hypothetical protein
MRASLYCKVVQILEVSGRAESMRRKDMKKLFTSTVLFMLLFAWGATQAYGADWYAAATGCVPYHDAIEQNLYSNANGRVRFKGEKIGTMYLVCSINAPTTGVHLYLTYQWAPGLIGPKPPSEVGAVLNRVSKLDGGIRNVVGISSDSYTGTGDAIKNATSIRIPDGELPLDFTNNYYYVIITVRRDTAEQNPVAFGVRLGS